MLLLGAVWRLREDRQLLPEGWLIKIYQDDHFSMLFVCCKQPELSEKQNKIAVLNGYLGVDQK